MPPQFYNLRDQAIYSAGDFFIPQEKYRAAPYSVNKPAPDDPVSAGIPAVYQARGGDDIRGYESFTPDFTRRGVFADPKEYGPGGMYEINPAALGFEFGPQGQVMRAGPGKDLQGQLGPTTTNPRLFGSSLDRAMFRVAGIPAREIADMYDARMQNIPGQDFRNFLKNFTGAQSNFAAARAPGTLQNIMGKIPGLTGILSAIGGNTDKSDRTRFAVDDAGYGTGTGRDQFGVFTGGKTLFGKTANYTERMKNEIADIAKNFGYDEDDLLGLDPAALEALGRRNKFRQTQVIDYVNKLRAKNIEAEYAKQKAELDRQAAIKRERDFAAQGRSDPSDPSRQGASGRRPGSGGPATARDDQGDRGAGQTGGYGYDSGGREGFGYGLADGGIVDMLEIYD